LDIDVGNVKPDDDATFPDLEKTLDLTGSGGRGASSTTVGFSSEGLETLMNSDGLGVISAALSFCSPEVTRGVSLAENSVLGLEVVPPPKRLEAVDVVDESEESPIR
jgi:hypothetical protein